MQTFLLADIAVQKKQVTIIGIESMTDSLFPHSNKKRHITLFWTKLRQYSNSIYIQ
jgi:hypothetical protein